MDHKSNSNEDKRNEQASTNKAMLDYFCTRKAEEKHASEMQSATQNVEVTATEGQQYASEEYQSCIEENIPDATWTRVDEHRSVAPDPVFMSAIEGPLMDSKAAASPTAQKSPKLQNADASSHAKPNLAFAKNPPRPGSLLKSNISPCFSPELGCVSAASMMCKDAASPFCKTRPFLLNHNKQGAKNVAAARTGRTLAPPVPCPKAIVAKPVVQYDDTKSNQTQDFTIQGSSEEEEDKIKIQAIGHGVSLSPASSVSAGSDSSTESGNSSSPTATLPGAHIAKKHK